jgi:parallel beta-helix repeat protein
VKADTPGDAVLIRGSAHPYRETVTCWDTASGAACGQWAVLEPQHKGTASAHISFMSYPGEQAVVDPEGAASPVYGVMIGGSREPGRCTGGARAGLTCNDGSHCAGGSCVTQVCYNGTNDGAACASDAECSGSGVCRRAGWYLDFEGIRFSNWAFYDQSTSASPASHVPSQYAVSLPVSQRPHPFVTIRDCEFTGNDGGGALHYNGSFGLLFERNWVHDNFTHGWTSAVNSWDPIGKAEGVPNVFRDNTILDNRDQPPAWCLANYCAGDVSTSNDCNDTVKGRGWRCPCLVDSDCQSGVCQANPVAGAGGCDSRPWHDGDTEGNGIIIDSPQGLCHLNRKINCTWSGDTICGAAGPCDMGEAGYTIIENNVIAGNHGYGINAFKASNTTIRNNTVVENGRRNTQDYNGEIVVWANGADVHNNIVEPRAKGQCTCRTDADCGGAAGSCWTDGPSWGAVCRNGARSLCTSDLECAMGNGCNFVAGLRFTYGPSIIYQAAPANIRTGANLFYDDGGSNQAIIWTANGGTITRSTVAGFKSTADAVANGWAGNGASMDNKFGDPLFVDPASDDFRLQAQSPALTGGDPAASAATDLLGVVRTDPPTIGAYQGVADGTTTTTTTTAVPPTTTTSTVPSTTSTSLSTVTTTTTMPGESTTTTTTSSSTTTTHRLRCRRVRICE